MIYPFKNFIEYLIAVGFKENSKIIEFFSRGGFIVPTAKDLRNIKSAFIYRLTASTARRAVKSKKKLAKRWLKKFKFDRLTEKNLEYLVDILNSPDIKRVIEVLLIRQVPATIISEKLYDKFRERVSSRTIKLYEHFFWNFKALKHDQKIDYCYLIRGKDERDPRMEAIYKSDEHAKWRLRVGANVEPVFATATVLEYLFFDFVEFAQTNLGDPTIAEKAKAVLKAAKQYFDMTVPSKFKREPGEDSEREAFIKTLQIRKSEFKFPSILDLKNGMKIEDAEFVPEPSKAIEDKIKQPDIVDIPVPEKKKRISVKEIMDSVPAEEYDGQD